MASPYPVAYKSDRAKDQAVGLSKSPDRNDQFLAPGVPVDAGPPPTVPPAAAAAPAAASAFPLAILAGIGGGIWLGLEVKKDIDRFKYGGVDPVTGKYKPPAALPFYDALEWEQPYDPDRFHYEPLDYPDMVQRPYKYGWGTPLMVPGWQWPDGMTDSSGFHAPVYSLGNTNWNYWTLKCDNGEAITGHVMIAPSGNCAGVPNWNPGSTNTACSGLTIIGNRPWGGIEWRCPSNLNRYAGDVVGGRNVGGSHRTVLDWELHTMSELKPGYANQAVVTEAGTHPLPYSHPIIIDDVIDWPGWGAAVAEPGTQPDGAEYQAQQQLMVPMIASVAFGTFPRHAKIHVPDIAVSSPEPGGAGSPPVQYWPPGHTDGPPPKGKEKKVNVATVGGRFWVALNVATEAQDLLEAAYEGLPKKLRRKGKVRPDLILRDIYDHFDQWDAAAFVQAYVNNQIEDMVYGSLGRLQAAGAQKVHKATGINRALAQGVATRKFAGGELPVPEVHFDGQGGYTVELKLPASWR